MKRREDIKNEELRGLVEQAYKELRAGDPTACVRTLARCYLRLIELRPDMLTKTAPVRGRRFPLVMRWPALGANLSLASVRAGKPEIDFVRERFATSEAMTYYEFVLETLVSTGA